MVKAKQAVAKLEAACAADPDDAECKEMFERKKQRLEQLESETATPFDLQEKLKVIGEKRDKKLKHAETVHEKVRKAQEEAERVDHELAECEDEYRQMEQRHRGAAQSSAEQLRGSSNGPCRQASAAFQLLAVWEGLRTLQAEIGTDAAANNAVELLLLVCQPIEQRRREQHEAQSKPMVDNDDTEMAQESDPTLDDIEQVEREFREVEKRRAKVLRLAEDSKRRKTEQSGEVGSGGSSFREQA